MIFDLLFSFLSKRQYDIECESSPKYETCVSLRKQKHELNKINAFVFHSIINHVFRNLLLKMIKLKVESIYSIMINFNEMQFIRIYIYCSIVTCC